MGIAVDLISGKGFRSLVPTMEQFYKSLSNMFERRRFTNKTVTYFVRPFEKPEPVDTGKKSFFMLEKRICLDVLIQYQLNLFGKSIVLYQFQNSEDTYQPVKYYVNGGDNWYGDDTWDCSS